MNDIITSLFDGQTPGAAQSLWTSRDPDTGAFVRNATSIMGSGDAATAVNAISPWANDAQLGATLITPWHVIGASHAGNLFAGQTIWFSPPTGPAASRIITAIFDIPDTDIRVAVLNANVGYTPASWLQTDYADFIGDMAGMLVLSINRDKVISVGKIANPTNRTITIIPPPAPLDAWHIPVAGGDSGNGVFLWDGSTLIYLGAWWNSVGMASAAARSTAAVQNAIISLGHATALNLTSFG